MEYQPPQFFKRGPAPLVRLTFFGLLSVLLMVLDARFQYAEPLRHALTVAVYPLQQVAIAPVTAYHQLSEFFSSRAALREENAALRTEQLRDAQSLLSRESLAHENAQLRALLQARRALPTPSQFAEIVYAGRDPYARKVIIDKGTRQGVALGQPVIDRHGVLGQITRVLPLLAEVTLITDKNHSIPVEVLRNGLRGIAYGSGDGSTLDLRFMPANAEIQAGDVLVTSGLDGVYPRGLPVATVSRVERDPTVAFARIRLVPMALTNQHRQVLVLQYDEQLPDPAALRPGKEAAPNSPASGARANSASTAQGRP